MHDTARQLSPDERRLVEEEEEFLARVVGALRARERPARRDDPDLLGRLAELREQAVEATAKDMPTVFQEMGLVRAMLERPRAEPLPDLGAPYFAHLRVREGDTRRDYALGRATFVDLAAGVRLVDWRYAPVARLFYAYREGDSFEERFPGRLAEGVVEARRVVVVQRGELVRISTGSVTLARAGDGRWVTSRGDAAASLGGGAGTAARAGALGVGEGARTRAARPDVTALLDREQWDALSVEPEEPLLVVGSAGSGKTTVALHRLARIAFEDARRYPVSRLQVVVPELGLARLAARLLEPLGLGRVAVRTLDTWSRGAFQSLFGVPPPRLAEETPPLVSRLKRHPALYRTLRGRPWAAGRVAPPWSRLRGELAELLSDRGFLEGVVRAAAGDLPTTAVDETLRHSRLQLATPAALALQGVDADRTVALDGESVDARTPEALAGTLDAEDLPILLFLRAYRYGAAGRSLAHLVVDEAEDVSLLELFVLGRQLGKGRSVTIAGDEGQATAGSFSGWDEVLAAAGAERAATCRLATTYRCPAPVARLAHAVLGPLAPPSPPAAGRRGVPVGRFEFPSEAHAHLFLAGAVRDLVEREPLASVAVVARGPEAARSIHRLLADMPEARLVLDGDFSFRPGVDLTDVESVKGLEFDYVVVPDASAATYPASDESRRRLHVAVTRASHQLWLASVGTPSPLVTSVPAVSAG
ncbi:MAG TPA: ATP-binding domain-containing protein [Anaeromyxobacteraceae bacterium]|nr:ATP-binding domain-containing protein [Anaeromyxobacteraceae bacterium]